MEVTWPDLIEKKLPLNEQDTYNGNDAISTFGSFEAPYSKYAVLWWRKSSKFKNHEQSV